MNLKQRILYLRYLRFIFYILNLTFYLEDKSLKKLKFLVNFIIQNDFGNEKLVLQINLKL